MWFFQTNRTTSPAPDGNGSGSGSGNGKSPISPSNPNPNPLRRSSTMRSNNPISRSTTLPFLPGQYPGDTAPSSITNSIVDLRTSTVLANPSLGTGVGPLPANEIVGRPPIASNKAGLLVTDELEVAIERCRKKVRKIAAECKKSNRRFRDIEFDLLEDRERCLHGLSLSSDSARFNPTDAVRVTQIFEKPQFFLDGATASDISQGKIGDCWFLSALAVVATAGLIERICVERDEKVGVYGFIFWRDAGWVDVIIDDLLFLKIPRWQQLSERERMLWKHNQDKYNREARCGSKALYFGSSLTENESWVPLIEKAFAKLHGDYAALDGGFTNEGVEDLTGAVSTLLYTQDVLDPDLFWEEEIMKINDSHRLFACFTPESYQVPPIPSPLPHPGPGPSPPGPIPPIPIPTPVIDLESPDSYNGLITSHAYSIIKAVEFRGKKFLKIRNPWGRFEWSGRWSDGSKEWTTPIPPALLLEDEGGDEKGKEKEKEEVEKEEAERKSSGGRWNGHASWLDALEPLEYGFGNDGEFIMEYDDFLKTWDIVERSRVFDATWAFSQLWLNVNCGDYPKPVGWGDVSFTFTLSQRTLAVIVLAQIDTRYFYALEGPYRYSLEFAIYPDGGQPSEQIVTSTHNSLWDRSVKVEVELDEGKYVVQVRIDRKLVKDKDAPIPIANLPATRKLAQKRTEQLLSASIAANFDPTENGPRMPLNPDAYAGVDLTSMEIAMHQWAVEQRERKEAAYKVHSPASSRRASGHATPGTPGTRTAVPGVPGEPGSVAMGSIADVDEKGEEYATPATSVAGDAEDVPPKDDHPSTEDHPTEEAASGAPISVPTSPVSDTKEREGGMVLNGEFVKIVGDEHDGVAKEEEELPKVVDIVESVTLVILPDGAKPATSEGEGSGGDKEGVAAVPGDGEAPPFAATEASKTIADAAEAGEGADKSEGKEGEEKSKAEAVIPIVRPGTPDSPKSPTVPKVVEPPPESTIKDRHRASSIISEPPHIMSGPLPPGVVPYVPPLSMHYPPMPPGMGGPMGMPMGPGGPMSPGAAGPTMIGGKLVHDGYHCDGCGGPIAGSRFHCMDALCADFDLCETCHAAGGHRADHRFIEIKHPKDTAKFRENANDTPETNSVTIGLRVYTHKDCQTTINGQLRHGHVIRQYMTMSKII